MFPCEFCELFKNIYFVEDLQTAGSETPERRRLFNKVVSLTTWSSLIVLERDCSTSISLPIFWENFFVEHLATTSHMMLFFLFADHWGLQFTSNSQARSIRCSYGNQAETSLSSCGHTYTDLGIGNEKKERTEKLVKVG